MAEAMLYDRMCPGGGWNCGNPRVYGVAGIPQVGPTVWALVALRKHPERPENQLSLAWLQAQLDQIRSLESLALAGIALRACSKDDPQLTERLGALHQPEAASTTQALAWATMALEETLAWLPASANR